ncbi:hypothetical protein, conserved [Cyanidioschyzon merolae strain 10D]|jgi:hypothetical protein|uniref:Uncharacterized protein n=1 Tax=Cyanidioschyzon merolae (strain NIES-3377 / 10D) TaxID=280699 RepID=M1VHY4_CYAM1|nr:hypothetical protein, conserved [Cyanidioschyzon merolae strain 10D]BAM80608.1 hypothetical protein, conserved [Cyanidioschyzon merolae strain 10D]|eukprot:XP_005536644.1 hypothetical protein, conserved [Cyanidioschyzon merolae strain 10D]
MAFVNVANTRINRLDSLGYRHRSWSHAFPQRRAWSRASTRRAQCEASLVALKPYTSYHLARWLAKEWDNYDQHLANPPFWAHIRVSYRPLPWEFLEGHAFYVESIYTYAPKLPYRATIIKITRNSDGALETESYKVEGVEQFYTAAFDRSKLAELVRQAHPRHTNRCVKLPEACNAVFEWVEAEQLYRCKTRPGCKCMVRRGDRDSYLDAQMTLSESRCTALDIGRCPQTHEQLWGAVAGPFDFVVRKSWSDEVPLPPAAMDW